jgi:hypothetical protein
MRKCIVAATSFGELRGCKAQLSAPQQAALEHDSTAALEVLGAQTGEPEEEEDLEPPGQYDGDDDGPTKDSAHKNAPRAVAPPMSPKPAPAPASISPARDADPCAGGK